LAIREQGNNHQEPEGIPALPAGSTIAHSPAMNAPDWQIQCDAVVFEQIKGETSFQQILALGRAVNSLQFVVAAFDAQNVSSTAQRSRINSFLFGSAIIYEGLLLVQKMNQQFGHNQLFKKGLHTLLKDPVALRLQEHHMAPARNSAVFHYEPTEFGKMVESASVDVCEFMVGRGTSASEGYFPFADMLATQLLMGRANADEEFYEHLGSVMSETRDLGVRFIEFSHALILRCLSDWKFIRYAPLGA
jgi:hypothetical protein